MPLQIELKPGEKVFINGAVIANGDHRVQLRILNDVAILRERDILTDETADTLCKQVYLLVQLMYMDAGNSGGYLQNYVHKAEQVVRMMSGCEGLIASVNDALIKGNLYLALKLAKKLIKLEQERDENGRKAVKCIPRS